MYKKWIYIYIYICVCVYMYVYIHFLMISNFIYWFKTS